MSMLEDAGLDREKLERLSIAVDTWGDSQELTSMRPLYEDHEGLYDFVVAGSFAIALEENPFERADLAKATVLGALKMGMYLWAARESSGSTATPEDLDRLFNIGEDDVR